MRHRLLAVAVAVATLLLSGCASATISPTPSPTPSATPTGTSLTDVAAGECYDTVSRDRVDVATCERPHDFEVFASLVLTGDAYPHGDLKALAEAPCVEAFADFVGIDYDDSALSLRYIAPSQSTWDRGDREVLCVVYDPAGPTTGSLSGTVR